MEEILIRFPVIGQKIFKQLDNNNFVKCREVGKIWYNFLDNDRLLWKRKIQNYAKNQVEFDKYWKFVTKNASVDILKKLAIASEEFSKAYPEELEKGKVSPLDVVASQGSIVLYKGIAEKMKCVDLDGRTALFTSSMVL